MRRTSQATVTLFLLCLAAGMMPAAAETQKWAFRVRGLSSNYQHEFVYPYFSTSHLSIDDGTGFEAAVEYRLRPHLGLELSAGRLNFDASSWTTQLRPVSFDPLVLEEVTIFEESGDFRVEPYSFGLLYYPLAKGRFDPYVGALIGWTHYDVDVDSGQEHEPDFSYGGKIGVEYAFGNSPWTVGVEYRHVVMTHETVDRDLYGDIDLDVGSLTIGYRLGGFR